MREKPSPIAAPSRLGAAFTPYAPTYIYREPPMIGAATAMVYATWGGMPYSVQGPGDIPLQQLCYDEMPTWVFDSQIVDGWPLASGQFVAQPLTYMPRFDSPLSHM